ncbi:MAG: hypothetical protein MZV65_18930 [Chromatiales bacterium]|nr:hypothetical protein [Chromatiales bacterium]
MADDSQAAWTCSGKFPLPVEVIPMARSLVARELVKLGGQPGAARGLHDRQRQPDPRRARPDDHRPGGAGDASSTSIAGVVTNGLFARRPARRAAAGHRRPASRPSRGGARRPEAALATLAFHGATRQVTGSALSPRDGARAAVLLECGLFQGPPEVDRLNERPFPFAPARPRCRGAVARAPRPFRAAAAPDGCARVSAAGSTPRRRRSTCSPSCSRTRRSCRSATPRWENRRRQRGGREAGRAAGASRHRRMPRRRWQLGTPLRYGERHPGCRRHRGAPARCRTYPRLGDRRAVASMTAGAQRKLVFSGDLGHAGDADRCATPEIVHEADVLLLESTYGDRDHRPRAGHARGARRDIWPGAATDGGNVLIPAFAISRAQEIGYTVGELTSHGPAAAGPGVPRQPDGDRATEVHGEHAQLVQPEPKRAAMRAQRHQPPRSSSPVHCASTRDVEDSMAINRIQGRRHHHRRQRHVTGGRIRHHLNVESVARVAPTSCSSAFRPEARPAAHSSMAPRTCTCSARTSSCARGLLPSAASSAHAGQAELVEHGPATFQPPPRVCLVHGEPDKMEALQARLQAVHGWKAQIPAESK